MIIKTLPFLFCFQVAIGLEAKLQRECVPVEARAETKHELLSAVGQAWAASEPVHVTQVAPYQYANPHVLTKKLASIRIPKVQFTQAPLGRVASILSELSVEFDAEKTGLNIVLISPEGKEPLVDIALRDLTLAEIIDLITQSVGYAYDIEHNVVTLRKADTEFARLATSFFPISRASVIRMTGNRAVNSSQERHSQAPQPTQLEEELAIRNFLQRAGIPFDESHRAPLGAELAFDGTQLIVTQTPRNLQKVGNLLTRYQQTRQVEIESKFIEVQEGVLEELGLKWNVANNRRNNHFYRTFETPGSDNLRNLQGAFGSASSTSGNGRLSFESMPEKSTSISNMAPIFPNAVNLGLGSTPIAGILGVLNNWQLNVLIEALEQHTGADLMSSPKLTVLSGKTAKITVAQILRYPEAYGDIESAVGVAGSDPKNSSAGVTITAGTPQHFVEKNVGVEMEVTPTVENDNRSVNLRLNPKVTEFEGFVEYGGRSIAISGGVTAELPSGFFQPIFSTREISTEVTIYDGATVVMGGLTREEVKQVHDKIPLLGDIPFVGRLFRSTGETSQKRSLLILVTARITNESGAPPQIQLAKMRQNSVCKDPA